MGNVVVYIHIRLFRSDVGMCSNRYSSCTPLVCMSVSNSKDIWRVLMWKYRFVDTMCPLVAPKNVSVPAALLNKAGSVRM
jgi:hypothetical protein